MLGELRLPKSPVSRETLPPFCPQSPKLNPTVFREVLVNVFEPGSQILLRPRNLVKINKSENYFFICCSRTLRMFWAKKKIDPKKQKNVHFLPQYYWRNRKTELRITRKILISPKNVIEEKLFRIVFYICKNRYQF